MNLPVDIRRAIEAHSRSCLPEEACGLLAADASGELRAVYLLTNVERSTHRFTVAPDEHYAALLDAESNDWHLAGSFHSHPTSGPVPSQSDIAGALDPDWVYLIAGPVVDAEIEIRCYRIRDGHVDEVPVTVGAAT